MLVHIVLKGEKGTLAAKVGDSVHRAIVSSLNLGEEGCFRIVTEQEGGLNTLLPQTRAGQPNATAVVLLYPTDQISDRKKRILFGRISEGLEQDCLVKRADLVIGILEQPYRNWYYGGAAMKLQQMMASGLV